MDYSKAWWALAAFVLIAALYAGNVKAEDEIYLGAWSKHFVEGEYNEVHNLVGVNYKSVVFARFKNSYGRDTHLIGYDFRWSYKSLHAGVIAGISHGYRECFGDNGSGPKFCAMPVPYVGYDAPVAPKFLFTHQMVAVTGTIQF